MHINVMNLALSWASLSAPLDIFMHMLHFDEGQHLCGGEKQNPNLCLNMITLSFNVQEQTAIKKPSKQKQELIFLYMPAFLIVTVLAVCSLLLKWQFLNAPFGCQILFSFLLHSWFLCTTGTTLHLILPHIVSNELHNSMWPAVRKYVVWTMHLTIKGCTFQFPLNLFTYICMSLFLSLFPSRHKKMEISIIQQGFQHLVLAYCFLKASFQALSFFISCRFSLFLAELSEFSSNALLHIFVALLA